MGEKSSQRTALARCLFGATYGHPLIDERTGNSLIGIDFPTRQHVEGFYVFDDDLAEQPSRVRNLLKSRGAYLGDDPDPNIRFQLWRDLDAHFGGEN